MQIFKKSFRGYFFLFFIICSTIITALYKHGLFGDGLMYLTVAFNRFKGYGNFWHQHYSKTAMPFFCEQPPLYFETLFGFYKLFNGQEYAEKIFTIFLLALSVLFTALIWNNLNKNTKIYKQLSWLPSFLLLTVPVYNWAYCNQVIETMVVPLCLLEFYVLLLLLEDKRKLNYILLFGSIILISMGLLITKGIQSIFLLAAPFLFFLLNKPKGKKAVLVGILTTAFFIGTCVLLYYNNDGTKDWVSCYVNKRLVATFNHVGATTTYHAEIIIRYFTELIPVLLFFIVISIYLKIANKYSFQLQLKNLFSDKNNLWLFLISVSASLPLAVTLEQRGFYLVPSFPFVIMALTNMYKRYIFYFLGKLFYNKQVTNISLVVLSLSSVIFFFTQYKTYKNDEGMLKDITRLKKIIPYGQTIRIDSSMWNMFALHSYLKKYNDNNLSITDTNTTYFILNKNNSASVPKKYIKLQMKTYWFDIYRNTLSNNK